MNPNIKVLTQVCKALGVNYEILHGGQNILKLNTPSGPAYFVNWSTPFNDHTSVRLCEDKDYTYTLLSPYLKMPRTRSYLDPDVNPAYIRYRSHSGEDELLLEIENEFDYPFIVKRNRGSHGTNVFSVEERGELKNAIRAIIRYGVDHRWLVSTGMKMSPFLTH